MREVLLQKKRNLLYASPLENKSTFFCIPSMQVKMHVLYRLVSVHIPPCTTHVLTASPGGGGVGWFKSVVLSCYVTSRDSLITETTRYYSYDLSCKNSDFMTFLMSEIRINHNYDLCSDKNESLPYLNVNHIRG